MIIFSLLGCSFQIPKTVSIKTKADYNFTIAKIEKDLSEQLNIEEMGKNFSGDSEVAKNELFDYWPDMDGDLQQFLLKVPVCTIPLDLDSCFGDLKVNDEIRKMSFVQEIKVPDIKNLDVKKEINLSEFGIPESDTGVPINPAVEIDAGTITFDTFSADDSFEECIIGEGALTLEFETDGWTGVEVDWKKISVSGGLSIPDEKWKKVDQKYVADLEGVPLKNENVDVKIVIAIKADSAKTKNRSAIKGNCKINKIQSIKVKLPEGTEAGIEKSEPFEVESSVKKIVLGDTSFVCDYYNTMPEGNDFGLTCKSDFLGIDGTKTLNSGTSETNPKKLLISADNGKNGKEIERDEFDNFPNVDVDAKIDFKSDDGFIKVTNVTPGEIYKIGVDFNIEFVWISMDIDSSKFVKEGDEVIDSGVELTSVFKSLEESLADDEDSGNFFSSISLKSLPIYVYCHLPNLEAFKDTKFAGNILLGKQTTDDNGEQVFTPYIENGAEQFLFPFGKEIDRIDLPQLEMQSDIITTDISKEPYSGYKDLANLAKSEFAGTLAFKTVELKLSNESCGDVMTIRKSEIDKLNENSEEGISYNVEIRAYLIIPLEFDVGTESDPKEKLYFFNLKNIGSGDDLFGRTEALNDETLSNYVNAIKTAQIGFESSVLPFKSSPADPALCVRLVIPDTDEKKLSFSGNDNLELTRIEINNMFETYPLKAKTRLAFPKGSFTFSRNKSFSTLVNIRLVTDGTISLSSLKGGD